jgi:hypothetical protein
LETVNEKIPVRITWMKNEKGKIEPEVLIDLDDVFSEGISISKKIEKFKKRYHQFLSDVKKLANKNKQKKASDYWKLSRLLIEFNNKIEREFFIINYVEAISKDMNGFHLSKTQVGRLFQFANYFKKNEINDTISYSHYRELTDKRNQLVELDLFEREKKKLLELSDKGKLPSHRTAYRNYLNEIVKPVLVNRVRKQ